MPLVLRYRRIDNWCPGTVALSSETHNCSEINARIFQAMINSGLIRTDDLCNFDFSILHHIF